MKRNYVNINNIKNDNSKSLRDGITYIGRLTFSKGFSVIQMIAKEIKITFNIIGDGPELENLKYFCKINDLKKCQNMGQAITRISCIHKLSTSQVSIVPSKCGESFSLVAFESMSLSTPVIGFNVGGLGDLLNNSKGGVSVDVNDDSKFVNTVLSLLLNPDYASQLGRNGYNFVKNIDFDIDFASLFNIYYKAIKLERNSLDANSI